MDENVINQLELLKNEKKTILEQANIDKRDLTPEEKNRCHEIDEQVYNLENKGGFNPTGFIRTSVKVNINAAKDDTPIPHVELKQENHEVYVPPVGAKEVMEYDKIHNVTSNSPTSEMPVVSENIIENNFVMPEIGPAPEKMPEPAPVETVPSMPEAAPAVPTMPEAAPEMAPSPVAGGINPVMPEAGPVTMEEPVPAVEPAMPEVPASPAPAEPNVQVTNPTMQTPQETQTNIVIPIKKDFFKKNKGKVILVAIIALLIGFKMNRIISYQYESGGSFGTVHGLYIYKYKYDDLKSISSVFVYEANENLIETVVEAYEDENCILLELSSTKILVIRKEKSTDDYWYYNNVSKDDTKKACSELNEKDGGKCIAF